MIISPSPNLVSEPVAFPSGTHCIGNLTSHKIKQLSQYQDFKEFIENQIDVFHLNKVGEVYHNFNGGGFTAVICLSESHLSIHTWPENNYITFDVFLSNYSRDNSSTTVEIYRNTVQFFDAVVLEEKILSR